jgi:uncharacterized protein (TIGR02145 family)
MSDGGTQCGGTLAITATTGANGNSIYWSDGSTDATRYVGTGTYYARTTTNAGCFSDWAAVEVKINPIPTISLSGGNPTQTVNQNSAITEIVYTASDAATISGSGFPTGVNGTPSGTSFTISGTPSVSGTFGYSLTASVDGCTSAAAVGTITVIAVPPPPDAASTRTWVFGSQTWSDRIVANPSNCTLVDNITTKEPLPALYRAYEGQYYYNWICVAAEGPISLCPADMGWRVPTQADFSALCNYLGGMGQLQYDVLVAEWGFTGSALNTDVSGWNTTGAYWSTSTSGSYGVYMYYGYGGVTVNANSKAIGRAVRCVK